MTHNEAEVTAAKNLVVSQKAKSRKWNKRAKDAYRSSIIFAVGFIIYSVLAVFYDERFILGFYLFGAAFVFFFGGSTYSHARGWYWHRKMMANQSFVEKNQYNYGTIYSDAELSKVRSIVRKNTTNRDKTND